MTAPRVAHSTVRFVDEYCSFYRNLFSDVRGYEAFKYLHIGMISDLKRKSLPAIAKLVGLENPQGLQHFFNNSPWDIKELRKRRIERLRTAVRGRKIILIIDETGDPKKGQKTNTLEKLVTTESGCQNQRESEPTSGKNSSES